MIDGHMNQPINDSGTNNRHHQTILVVFFIKKLEGICQKLLMFHAMRGNI